MNKETIKEGARYLMEKVLLTIFGLCIAVGTIGSIATGFSMQTSDSPTQNKSGEPELTGTQQQPADSNLENKKPTSRWRLNSNGYSQKYVHLTGEDRTERMKQLITNYNRDAEELYPAIKTIARIHKVYPEVIICIAYADSSLGKHLKTKNNVGNVNNNDRGNRQDYDNIEQGFNAIGKVLNNRYLGKYISIDQLAGSSNPNGPNYATELTNGIRNNNRYNNVLNCLGMIRNKGVPANFAFRF